MSMAGTGVDSLQIDSLAEGYASDRFRVADVIAAVADRIARAGDDRVWIHRVAEGELRARAEGLDAERARDPAVLARRPLFGIPFAVKDNIDVAGLPTTAACPAFAYRAERSARAVDRLLSAGAVLVCKTNLDQFATGLVGTRSPYGVARNPFDARYIPGGSSSGSAVAVASGLVSFSLGTDTAGSGRVPAAFNNLVGLKPTRGLISTRGVVPACRSLDCVSIFALSAGDAARVLQAVAAYDPEDPYSREWPAGSAATLPRAFRFGVPAEADLVFFGNEDVEARYRAALARLEGLGGQRVVIDFSPFRAAAELLYSGPWVAERLAAVEPLLKRDPDAMLPVTRRIIEGGARYSAVDTFRAMYRLNELRQRTRAVWSQVDIMVVPTAGTIYTVDEVNADPIGLNSNLGIYTNFTNLLDLSAHAVPCGFQANGLPTGITLLGPAFADLSLAALALRFQQDSGLPLGARGERLRPATGLTEASADGRVAFAVFGAHMNGLPLNRELLALGARFVGATRTRAAYRLYALEGALPRPGVVRGDDGNGAAIEAELWSLEPAALGPLLVGTAPPLCIGTVELADGRKVLGFLCEAAAAASARDITAFGGWRAYLEATR